MKLIKTLISNNIFSIFKPQRSTFYSLLEQMSDNLYDIAKVNFESFQASTNKDVKEYCDKIKECRDSGNRTYKRIFRELNYTFITPFDREDIHYLAKHMIYVVESVNSCAKRIMLYNPKSMPKAAEEMSAYLLDAAEYIKKAIYDLDSLKKDIKNLDKCCKKLDMIESKADDVFDQFLIDLFKNEKDAIELVKLKDILNELENAIDASDEVGKTINTIIIKYA